VTTAFWIILALVVLFGAALLSRRRGTRPSSNGQKEREREPVFPPAPPLQPGEQYDTAVKLTTLPNAPLAELWRQRLREHGIEAFLKGGSPYAVDGFGGIPNMSPNLAAELWVGEHDAERARELFPELG
jgi:Putative prokaryotic signal transducing protein